MIQVLDVTCEDTQATGKLRIAPFCFEKIAVDTYLLILPNLSQDPAREPSWQNAAG